MIGNAWFIVPYKRRDQAGQPGRYCAMDDFSRKIFNANGAFTATYGGEAYSGRWREAECFGNHAIVKVVGVPGALIEEIDAEPGFVRVPLTRLDDPTATLGQTARTRIISKLQALGFTNAEINAAFPSGWDGPYQIIDILRFALSRRLTPRFDEASNTIVLDGPERETSTPEQLDSALPGIAL